MKKLPIVVVCLLSLLGLGQALEPPAVKEGLWSIHTQMIDNPGNVRHEFTQKLCRSHAFDQHIQEMAKKMPGCKIVNENFSGGTYTVDVQCTNAGSSIRSKATTTFQGDTAFHSESHVTYSPPFHGMTDGTMTMDQKYLGACPAGAQPGDRIGPNGSIMHAPMR